MNIYKTILELKSEIDVHKRLGKTIGFVPTMGCLHDGHISLVNQSIKENDITAVSIFVNPTQFNNPEDLNNYPRTIDADIEKLNNVKCDIIFIPTVKEMYPEEDKRVFDFGNLDKVMEGKYRLNHFNGVGQIVSRLFDVVNPDKAYFGEKDFQQLAIIKNMVKQLNLSVKIVPCAIIREPNGLAMSSRNERLTPKQREDASIIYNTLNLAATLAKEESVEDLKNWIIDTINSVGEVEYFEIVDSDNLSPINKWSDSDNIIGCIAVYFEKIRLIDNINFNI